ncbi:MAG: Na+/H+ antiporter subunit G [Phreatobacter sp.]
MIVEIVVSVLLLIGGGFALVGSIGLARLPDIFMRLHGPTKATTLGLGALVVASLIQTSTVSGSLSLKELAISVFLFITAPVSAHLIAKAALKAGASGKTDAER